eukprot:GHVT01039554.1.p1 GENE.GHVT01039554.1~~GHVT01039554.1.p1  ORF type:complete len:269 (+),score=43.98 GHVT01039554.1:1751-2557(+)
MASSSSAGRDGSVPVSNGLCLSRFARAQYFFSWLSTPIIGMRKDRFRSSLAACDSSSSNPGRVSLSSSSSALSSQTSSLPSLSTSASMFEASSSRVFGVAQHPWDDGSSGLNLYRWGALDLPSSSRGGARRFNESPDNLHGQASPLPWPSDLRIFQGNESPPEIDRVNTQYDYIAADRYPERGYGAGKATPAFGTQWEKLLSYHHGLYRPETLQEMTSADDIRLAVNEFAEKVHLDNPKDACKYLAIEEFKCLKAHQTEMVNSQLSSN